MITLEIEHFQLVYKNLNVNALWAKPKSSNKHLNLENLCIFTHGYTSHKASILSWLQKLSQNGYHAIIFDLPGHFLGGLKKEVNFNDFTTQSHMLFESAVKYAQSNFQNDHLKSIVIGGHSIGGYFSLMASNLEIFKKFQTYVYCVGLGVGEKGKISVMQQSLFKPTLDFRAELISKDIHPDAIFPWLSNVKRELSLQNQNYTLITGKNDIICPPQNIQNLTDSLYQNSQDNKNLNIKQHIEQNLPHDKPEMISSFITRQIKKILV